MFHVEFLVISDLKMTMKGDSSKSFKLLSLKLNIVDYSLSPSIQILSHHEMNKKSHVQSILFNKNLFIRILIEFENLFGLVNIFDPMDVCWGFSM